MTEAMVAAGSARSGRPTTTIRREQLLGDRRPAPALRPGMPILAHYVDNGNFMCWGPEEGADCSDAFAVELDARGLAFKDEVRGDRELICLGLHFDGPNRPIKNKPDRVWRQYYALHALLRQRPCSGKILEVVDGNVINSFMVDRTCFSVLYHIWQHAIELGARVEGEIRAAAALTLVAVHAAYRGPAPWAFMSDASEPGFALHETRVLPEEALAAYRWKERWRLQGSCDLMLRCHRPLPPASPRTTRCWRRCSRSGPRARESSTILKGEKLRPPGLSSRAAALFRRPGYDENEDLVPPLSLELLDAARWRRVVVGAWKRPDAIHIKEW